MLCLIFICRPLVPLHGDMCMQCLQRHSRAQWVTLLLHGPKTSSGTKHIKKHWITSRVFETQEWRDMLGNKRLERRGKNDRQLQGEGWSDGDRGETVAVGCEGAYKLNGTLMVNGGALLTRPLGQHSLSVPCSCCCVFSPSTARRGTPSLFLFCFVFLWFAELGEVLCFSWGVLKGLKTLRAH